MARVTPKPDIAELCEEGVRIVDGSVAQVDTILYCTGYRITFPFFGEAVFSAPENHLHLYHRVFPPGQRDIALIGSRLAHNVCIGRPGPDWQEREATDMDLARARTRLARLGATLVCAVATVALTLTSSGVASVPGESSSAAAVPPVPVALRATSVSRAPKAPVPARPSFMSIFTPRLSLPAPVKAPSSKQTAAFATLNTLVDTETRLGDAIIGMRASIDRAAAAASAAGAQLWVVRQTNATAEYALAASGLVGALPALQAAVVRAFVADKMSVTLTPAQIATAKAQLLRGLPASYGHLLEVVAAAYQPSTGPEVAEMRDVVLDTQPLEQALANAVPRAVVLPAALLPSSLTAAEVRLAAALKSFAGHHLAAGAAIGVRRRRRGGSSRTPGSSPVGRRSHPASARPWARPCTSPRTPLRQHMTGPRLLESRGQKLPKSWSPWARGSATRSPPSPSRRPTPPSAKVPARVARATAGAEGAATAPPPTASRTRSLGPAPATCSRPPASSPSSSRPPTTSISRSVSSASLGQADVALDTATAMQVGATSSSSPPTNRAPCSSGSTASLWPTPAAPSAGGGSISVKGLYSATVTWPDGTAITVFSGGTIAIAHETITCNSSDDDQHVRQGGAIARRAPRGPARRPGRAVRPASRGERGRLQHGPARLAFGERAATSTCSTTSSRQSWRITQQSSLFYYPRGTSTATFTDLAFPSSALTVASLTPTTVAAAAKDCKAEGITNPDCSPTASTTWASPVVATSALAGAEARVQAATGGPTAIGLPDSSGTVRAELAASRARLPQRKRRLPPRVRTRRRAAAPPLTSAAPRA